MANRTVKDATSVKGTNPQYLVEKIIRSRIYDSRYWKEECFALTAELLVDKAMQLKYVGGVFGGNIKPTPFLCLILKMLQIQPEKDIVIEFIKNEDFKYVRALGAYYMRLTGTSLDCYKYLEPLLNDYRKLRVQNRQGVFELSYMDEFIDQILREERLCDVILPRIQKRQVHEETGELEPRVSALDEDLDELGESSGEEELPPLPPSPPPLPPARASPPAPTRHHRRSRSREREPRTDRDGYRRRSRSREREHRGERREREREHRGERPEKRHRGEGHESRRERHHRGEHRERDRERERRPRHDEERRGRHHRGEEERREIEEANALRARLGLPPLRP